MIYMHYYEVAPTAIIRPGTDVFTYSSKEALSIGEIVSIPVGKKSYNGVIIKSVAKPKFETKDVTVTSGKILPLQIIELCRWVASYYNTPLAACLQLAIPSGLHKKRRNKEINIEIHPRNRTNILFTPDQKTAINTASSNSPGTFILHGVTGSGKTAVYIDLAKSTLASGKSCIVLVPEIALTSQVISEFSNHFDNILVMHSSLSEAERHNTWQAILESDKPLIIIGARSALFAPVKHIGLIVLDESHEPSYKQEQSPRYSALRVATVLGKLHDAHVIFGSATPSISEMYMAQKAKRPIIKMTTSAVKQQVSSDVSLIDMTKRNNFKKHRFLSDKLLGEIQNNLNSNRQTLIFHNRRGNASTTLCSNCGWTSLCDKCHVPFTLHSDTYQLQCHICGNSSKIPNHCPECQNADIIFKGYGTKLIESEIKKLFPDANVARFDADNNELETLRSRYSELYSGKIDIAIGTQIVAKGLDLPHLGTVGVIQADSGLALPDFGTIERNFQLLTQVIGRVGRNNTVNSVVIQTYQPQHPAIVYGINKDYEGFYNYALEQRKISKFPPFTHLLKLTTSYKTESGAIKAAQTLHKKLKISLHQDVSILGPVPAFYERQFGNYRWQLVLKSPRREYLLDAIKLVPTNNWQYEIDPTSLL